MYSPSLFLSADIEQSRPATLALTARSPTHSRAPEPFFSNRIPSAARAACNSRQSRGAPNKRRGVFDRDPLGAPFADTVLEVPCQSRWPALAFPAGSRALDLSVRESVVQGMGNGLPAALRAKVPRPVLVTGCFALLVANTINIGADLARMADAATMFTGINSHVFVILLGPSYGS
jgi:hypothetical protein